MNTVTIPKRIAKNDDLVVVPRKEYEQLLRFWMNTERLSRHDTKAIAKGLREIAQGKFLTSKEVRHELDYRLAYQVVKNLKRFPRKDQERVIAALEEMKVNPFGGDVKLIQGELNLYRRRIGSYRIYFRPYVSEHILDIPEIIRKQSH